MTNLATNLPQLVILKLDESTLAIWADVVELARGIVELDYVHAVVVEWFHDKNFEDADVNDMARQASTFVIEEISEYLDTGSIDYWQRTIGLQLRNRLILYAMKLRELFLHHGLYGVKVHPTSRFPYAYVSSRGKDALLLAYDES